MPDVSENTSPVTTPYQPTESIFSAEEEKEMKSMSDEELRASWHEFIATSVHRDISLYSYTSPTGDLDFERKINGIIEEEIKEFEQNPKEFLTVDPYSLHKIPASPTNKPSEISPATAADPINLFSGDFRYESTDFQIMGAEINFSFSRSYSQQTFYYGPMGFNWDHCYNLWLRISDDNKIIHRSTGALSLEVFRKHEQFSYWIPPDGAMGVLIDESDSFRLKLPDGSNIFYTPHPILNPKIHIADRIEDRFGNYLKFNYADGLLKNVLVNHPDRKVTFQYDSENRIIAILDFSHRAWKYTYDDLGDLVAVTTPATEQYKKGLNTFYEYTSSSFADTNLQHNLTSIIDATGQIYLENEYGSNQGLISYNRVIRQRQGGGETIFDYHDVIEEFNIPYESNERPAHQTIITERNGNQIRYLFNRFGNMIFKEEYARIDGIPQLISSHYRYNKDGKLIGVITPLGVITQYLYGRDYFEKKHPQEFDYRYENDSNLSDSIRQGFNNLLAVIKRSHYFTSINLLKGLWSCDIFPDVYKKNNNDIVQKFVYEPEFSQLQTISDPRFTESADPDFNENEIYHKHLVKFRYRADRGFQNYLLESIHAPVVSAPDGTIIGSSTMQFTQYNSRGKLLECIGAEGLVRKIEYNDINNGLLEGMPRKMILDPEGLNIQSAVDLDELGRVIKTYSPKYFDFEDGRFTASTQYNELGQVVSMVSTSPFDIGLKRKYDRTGNLKEQIAEVKNSDNELMNNLVVKNTYDYDVEFNLVKSVTGNLGDTQYKTHKYLYDGSNRLRLTISPEGRKAKAFYNERSLLQKEVIDYGGMGISAKKFYDADGRIIRLIDARKGTYRVKYDAFGRIVETLDPLGNKSYVTYDKLGNILVERFFEYVSDANYKLLERNEYHYDELGRLNKKSANLFEYTDELISDPQNANVAAGPGMLLSLSMFYDVAGRIIKTIDQSGRESKREFDILGRIIKQTDLYGNELNYQYDRAGNVIRIDKREVIKDVASNDIINNRYFSVKYVYDELNRIVESTDTLGNKNRFKYDSRGLLEKHIDALGHITSSVYDIFGRTTSNTNFLSNSNNPNIKIPVTTSYQYDLDDLLIAQTDALNRITTFQYNSLGKRVSTTLPDLSKDLNEYDFSGILKSYMDRNGLLIHYTRDIFGREVRKDIDKSQLSATVNIEGGTYSTNKFDAAGRLLEAENDFSKCTFLYNSLGWLLEENSIANPLVPDFMEQPMKISRTYNQNGALSILTYPSGRKLQYHRDIIDRITGIEQLSRGMNYCGDVNAPEQYTIATAEYEGSQRKRLSRNNGSSTEFGYDFGGRMNEIKHKLNDIPFLQMQFYYDAVGNMKQKVEMADDFQSTDLYNYDELYRLNDVANIQFANISDLSPLHPYNRPIPAEIPLGQNSIDSLINSMPAEKFYEYDLVGNRVKIEETGRIVSEYEMNNDLDQYSKVDSNNFIYDLNGNVIEDQSFTYTYDFENHLISVTSKSENKKVLSYIYDTYGRKVFEIKDSNIRQLVYDSINAIEEYQDNTLAQSLILDSGIDNLLQLGMAGNDHYLYSDLTKSIRYLFKNNDKENFYVFDEFGKILHTGGLLENPFLFNAKKLIPEINKYDFFTRVYDPSIGRFQQRDQKGYIDGPNLYTFLGNSPLSNTDPFGTESRPEQMKDGEILGAINKATDIIGKPQKYLEDVLSEGDKVAKSAAKAAKKQYKKTVREGYRPGKQKRAMRKSITASINAKDASRAYKTTKIFGDFLDILGFATEYYDKAFGEGSPAQTSVGKDIDAGASSTINTLFGKRYPGVAAVDAVLSILQEKVFGKTYFSISDTFSGSTSSITVSLETMLTGDVRGLDVMTKKALEGKSGIVFQVAAGAGMWRAEDNDVMERVITTGDFYGGAKTKLGRTGAFLGALPVLGEAGTWIGESLAWFFTDD